MPEQLDAPRLDDATRTLIADAIGGSRGAGTAFQTVVSAGRRNLCVNAVEAPADEERRLKYYSAAAKRAAVRSRRLLDVVDWGCLDGCFWIAYEMGTATSLADYGKHLLLSMDTSFRLLSDVARALDGAAAEGLFPHEVRPESVFVAGRGARVGDLGTARESLGEPASGAGSDEAYVAPEVLRGEAGERSGVFSFGALIYNFLAGAAPRRGHARNNGQPSGPVELVPLADWRPDLPDAVDSVVAAAMADDPRRRPRSATEVYEMARRAMRGEGPARGMKPNGGRPEPSVPPIAPARRPAKDTGRVRPDRGEEPSAPTIALNWGDIALPTDPAWREAPLPSPKPRPGKTPAPAPKTSPPAPAAKTPKAHSPNPPAPAATAAPAPVKPAKPARKASAGKVSSDTRKSVSAPRPPGPPKPVPAAAPPSAQTQKTSPAKTPDTTRPPAPVTPGAGNEEASVPKRALRKPKPSGEKPAPRRRGPSPKLPVRRGKEKRRRGGDASEKGAPRPGAARVAVLAAALGVGAVTGLLLGGSSGQEPARAERINTAGMSVTLPPGWRSTTDAGPAVLSARDPGESGAALEVRLVSERIEPRERSEPVQLGSVEAWRDGAPGVIRFVSPTTAGKLVIACRASSGAGSLRLCERTASTLRLRTARALPLAGVVAVEDKLSAAVARLREERTAARMRLARASRPSGQRLAAETLARIHDRAGGVLAELAGAEGIAAAARDAAAAYGALAAAAESGAGGRWDSARERVRRNEATLTETLAARS